MSDAHGFVATAAGVHEDEDCLVATLDSGADSYMMFQRHPELGHPDDDGVYVEIDDQINAGFNIVERCTLSPDSICVVLSSPLKGYSTLNASLSLPAAEFNEFGLMLRRIFAGYDDRLAIEGQT